MNYKKFGLFSLIISVLIVSFCVSMMFIKTDAPLNVTTPASYKIYKYATQADEVLSTDERFDEITDAFLNITEMTIFNRIVQGGKLDELPSLDVDSKYGYFLKQTKLDNVCLEVIFSATQSQIVSIDGNTRMIDYLRMIFVVSKSEPHIVAIYTSPTVDGSYSDSLPIIVRADTTALYNACV